MKIQVAISLLVALAVAAPMGHSADITMRGAAKVAPASSGIDVKLASTDLLNNPTALLNKNTAVSDNNVFITRSNLIFTQADRVALTRKVEQVLAQEADATVAHVTRNVMKAVSAPDTDTVLATKAHAVVVATGDTRTQKIADFVTAVATKEATNEASDAMPTGVVLMLGTKDILKQPTALVNKNVVASDNQVAVSKSNVALTQNDMVAVPTAFRMRFMFPQQTMTTTKTDESGGVSAMDSKQKEQFGLWGGGLGGYGLGWRYPLSYWNLYGAGLYGGGCGLGVPFGSYFYC